MDDGDALLAAILREPADDTPRLAYADWLDEHDHPERAEFVRVSISVGKGGENGWVCQPQYHHKTHSTIFLEPPLEPCQYLYSRGFIDEIRLSCSSFLGGEECSACLASGGDRGTAQDGRRYACEQCMAVSEIAIGSGVVCPHCQSGRMRKWRVKSCSACNGTGRTPGLAADLFRAHPITRVVLTDRDPYATPTEFFQWWGSEDEDVATSEQPTVLPWRVFERLPHKFAQYIREGVHCYQSERAALDALSAACVRYGRELAGLPGVWA